MLLQAMMENFIVNAKSDLPSMIDANVENTLLDSTVVEDRNFPFGNNKTEYVCDPFQLHWYSVIGY